MVGEGEKVKGREGKGRWRVERGERQTDTESERQTETEIHKDKNRQKDTERLKFVLHELPQVQKALGILTRPVYTKSSMHL